ncbi:PPT2 family protein [Megaselia abdita]
MRILWTIIISICCAEFTISYKPVVLLHGILSGSDSMSILKYEIEKNHPGTKVYNCDEFGGWFSLENAWKQVVQIKEYVQNISSNHPEGIHLIGYSQGGLLARAVIQSTPDHNIKKFISLSSPQAGQYGTSFLHLIFPDLAAKTAFELFYSKVGQHTSVGNYWNDPKKQELYYKYSVFLPYINNEIESSNSTFFKEALTKLEKLVLVGGPDDGVITPWESRYSCCLYSKNY